MNASMVTELGRETIITALMVVAPMMIVGFIVGITVSLFQALTQIQEMTLAFVPKLVAMSCALIIFSDWILQKLLNYTKFILSNFSHLGGV